MFDKAIERARAWLSEPRQQLTGWSRRVRAAVDLVRQSIANLLRDRAMESAAALAFHTLFSLLPMLVLMLVVFQAFHGLDEYRDRLEQGVIEFLLPPNLVPLDAVGDEVPSPAITADPAFNADRSPDLLATEFDGARRQMAGRIRSFLRDLGKINFAGLGAVGLLVFIYGATALLSTIERSFNMILGVSGARPWYKRLMVYYTVITLGPLVIIAGQMLQSRFLSIIHDRAWGGLADVLAGPMVVLSPLLTSWLVLFSMFVLLPRGRLQLRPAALGALLSAILWVIAKEGFSAYVSSAAITTLYGAVAIVPLFLLWLWMAWMIVLLGLEVADTIRRFGHPEHELLHARAGSPPLFDDAWLIRLAGAVAAAFERGESLDAYQAEDRLGLPAHHGRKILKTLEDSGIIRQVEEPLQSSRSRWAGLGDGVDPCYVPARPPNRVPVAELLELAAKAEPWGQRQTADREESEAEQILSKLKEARRAAVDGLTLADLI